MRRQTTFRGTALGLFAAALLCGGSAKAGVGSDRTRHPSPAAAAAQRRCAATTDDEIVAAIHEKIKADKRFDDQWAHINVSSQNRVVTLSGWAKGQAQVNALLRYARRTPCVRRVVNRLRGRPTLGCGPNQKPCGDICIDKNLTCNLLGR